jgi:hypothetical protein
MEADRQAERSAQEVFAFRVRMARQRANEEAAAEKLAGKAAADAARDQATALASLERRIATLKGAIDPTFAAQSRLDAEMKEATALYKMGAISASDYAKAVGRIDEQAAAAARGQTMLNGVMVKGADNSKLMTRAGLNLSRQFADIGVTAAMGMNPLMILIQQGPQIADVFAEAKTQGVGFSAMLRGIGAQIAPLLPILAGVGLAVGAVVGAFGLFEREIDKNTKYATTWGDTWKATVKVVGDIIMDGPIGDALKWLGGAFGKTLDAITDGVMWFLDKMVGHFGAAFQMIVKYWYRLPEVFGVIVQGAANITIDAVEGMINTVLKGVNYVLKSAGKATLDPIDLPKVKLANAKLAAEYDKLAGDISGSFKKGREGVADRIAAQADKEYLARQKAKKASKEAADERETEAQRAAKTTAEYIAQLEDEISKIGLTEQALGRLAAARQIELALRFGNLKDAERIHQLILEKEALEELARALKEAMEARAEFQKANVLPVAFENTPATLSKDAANAKITRDSLGEMDAALAKVLDRLDAVQYGVEGAYYALRNADWMGAAQGAIRAAIAIRDAFDKSKGGSTAQGVGAVASAAGSMIGGRVGGALGGAAAGAQLGTMLMPGIGTAIGAVLGGIAGFLGGGSNKKAQARAQAAEEARNKALEIAAQKVENEIRLLQLQGKATEALARSREVELAAMDASLRLQQQQIWALEDAAKRRSFEISLMEAANDNVGALAATRADELKMLEDSLKPLQQAVWALQDLREAADKLAERVKATRGLEADMLDAMGRSSEALAVRRALELEQMDAALRPLQATVWALEDSRAAAERAGEALRGARDRMQQFVDSLKDFQRELTFGDTAGRNPVDQYSKTKAEFDRLNALDANDPTRLAGLRGAGEAFLSASRTASATGLAYNRDLMAVRRAVEASQSAAQAEVNMAQAELAKLDALIGGQSGQIAAAMTTTDAVNALRTATDAYAAAQVAALGALGAQQAANAQATADLAAQLAAAQAQATAAQTAANPANSNTPSAFDPAAYLAARPDVLAEYNRHTSNSDIAYLASLGVYNAEGFAAWHNSTFNTPKAYATGGMHSGGLRLVGEEGPELEATGPARIYSARDTARMMGGDNSDVVAELRATREALGQVRSELAEIRRNTKETADFSAEARAVGIHARGEAPDEPVITQAA